MKIKSRIIPAIPRSKELLYRHRFVGSAASSNSGNLSGGTGNNYWELITTDEEGNELEEPYIITKYPAVSEKELSAHKVGTGGSGGGGGGDEPIVGVTSLSNLTDVDLSSPLSGHMLVYNGTHWVNQEATGTGGSYVHPETHPASMIVEDFTRRFVTDTEKDSWNAKETPTGAQTKATTALNSAKDYTDGKVKTDVPEDALFTDTVYTHPTYTARASGLYKITVDTLGHISGATAVVKSDITGLGIPAQDTTYGIATTSADGLMSSTDKSKLNGIASNANNYSLPTASDTVLGGIKVGSRLTISSGVLSADIQSDNNFTSTYKTKLDGIATEANKYIHPSYTERASGLYKVTVDDLGHISGATAVVKKDITGLGIPAQDTTYSAGNGISLSSTTFSVAGGYGLVQETSGLKLGTPSNITLSSTNSVATDSHTHNFTLGGTASQYLNGTTTLVTIPTITAGNGLTGGGQLTANRTLTLGKPSTLTTSTIDEVTASSHTHAITTTSVGDANTIIQTDANGGTKLGNLMVGGNWKIEQIGTELQLKYNDVVAQRFLLDGSIVGLGEVTSYGASTGGEGVSLLRTGGTMTGAIRWQTQNKLSPYIGQYSTDGSLLISLGGQTTNSGLVLGSTSGNLLWKGSQILDKSNTANKIEMGNGWTIQQTSASLTIRKNGVVKGTFNA